MLCRNRAGFGHRRQAAGRQRLCGISPDNGRAICAMPADAALAILSWKNAIDYAVSLDALGHRDWRVPTQNELDVLYRKRAVIGGFSITGWYWSCSPCSHGQAWVQRFSDGHQFSYPFRSEGLLLRCICLADPAFRSGNPKSNRHWLMHNARRKDVNANQLR